MVPASSEHPRDTDRIATTACRLYEAEVQLHIAHQSQVDVWIRAASEKLHAAIQEHSAAVQAASGQQYRVAS
ncbi:MAG TPA: hypothetical protein VJ831_07155 [Jatrophihabitantaceae bacterium]|nr:hypothetical protein [Jatrophihabitantaceae bacterium]